MSRDGDGVLLLGATASGKSDLALRLLGRGFNLVADDRVDIADGMAVCPDALAGLLEVRGLGIFRMTHVNAARLALAVELGAMTERLPMPRVHPELGVPLIQLDAFAASAADRVMLALDAATGRVGQVAGSFAV